MKVEAERDDGALLVTDGLAAAIIADGQEWVTSRESALARGEWEPSDAPLPAVSAGLPAQLAAFHTKLERSAAAQYPAR
jgi:hypothetical protein